MDVAKRIRILREKKGLTTNKLANLSGVSQSYLRDIELGKKNPTVEMLSYICHGLDISLQDFFVIDEREVEPFLKTVLRKFSSEEQMKLADFLKSIRM